MVRKPDIPSHFRWLQHFAIWPAPKGIRVALDGTNGKRQMPDIMANGWPLIWRLKIMATCGQCRQRKGQSQSESKV